MLSFTTRQELAKTQMHLHSLGKEKNIVVKSQFVYFLYTLHQLDRMEDLECKNPNNWYLEACFS